MSDVVTVRGGSASDDTATLVAGRKYAADSSGGALVLFLPALSSVPAGAPITVADAAHAAATNPITIQAVASDTVDGAASPRNYAQLNSSYGPGFVMTFIAGPSGWLTING